MSRLKKFPTILAYIEAHHPEVHKLVELLSLQNSFIPRRGGGMTFLVPNTEYSAKIQEIADGDEPEKATDMIQSLLIPLNLETVQDWRDNSDELSNLLDKRIEITSVTETKIVLKNGATITKNEVFKPFERSGAAERANMSVWNIQGSVAVDAPAVGKRRAGKTATTRVRARNIKTDDLMLRTFVDTVTKKELQAWKSQSGPIKSIKLTVLCNYVRYLVQHKAELEFKEHLEYFKQVCDPLACGGIEAAFYLTFCCRDAMGVDGVRRVGLNDTITLVKILQDKTIDLFAAVDKPLNVISENLGYPVNTELSETIAGLAKSVRPRVIKDLMTLYDAWVATSEGHAAARFKAVQGLKVLIDEFKHYLSLTWLTFRQNPDFVSRQSAYKDFLDSLSRFGSPIILNNPAAQSSLLGIMRIYAKSPKDVTPEHVDYLTDFLSEDGAFRSERQELRSDDSDPRFAPLDSEYLNEDMELSASTRTELRNYMAKHGGKLPDDLLK